MVLLVQKRVTNTRTHPRKIKLRRKKTRENNNHPIKDKIIGNDMLPINSKILPSL